MGYQKIYSPFLSPVLLRFVVLAHEAFAVAFLRADYQFALVELVFIIGLTRPPGFVSMVHVSTANVLLKNGLGSGDRSVGIRWLKVAAEPILTQLEQ